MSIGQDLEYHEMYDSEDDDDDFVEVMLATSSLTNDALLESDYENSESEDESSESDDESSESDDERSEADDERSEADDERSESDDERSESDYERSEYDEEDTTKVSSEVLDDILLLDENERAERAANENDWIILRNLHFIQDCDCSCESYNCFESKQNLVGK
ncbi:serine/threonine-protein phosphatase 4 regulatory subunit 2-like [Coccinella septempunctata]|uniref:serine/threonine-protein phosphatase 4 regulatory subunit 2-like n=1 Tax=Coccinella septempunctata TaxID=41139 RepID=UPI001D05FBAD|nr:serine/threonine-protein phosphatase 4 regulatory subunit 2-like [Coccinella septempunctata]